MASLASLRHHFEKKKIKIRRIRLTFVCGRFNPLLIDSVSPLIRHPLGRRMLADAPSLLTDGRHLGGRFRGGLRLMIQADPC